MTRLDAFTVLMSLPDEPDLGKRGKVWKFAGDAQRRESIKRELAAAWLARRVEDWRDESEVISLRRSPLRIVRRAHG